MTQSIVASPIPVLTIDGPSGSGKGTISRRVARRLGWHFLDSGALYRAVGVAAMREGLSLNDEPALRRCAEQTHIEFETGGDGEPHVLVDRVDVTDQLRTETVGAAASVIASLPTVRVALLQKQRDFRRLPGLVADGRDMGTVVFTDASFKVFLTASAHERARRRHKQLKDKGLSLTLDSLLLDILARDARDTDRAVAPLKPATDAVMMDTTGVSIESVVDQVLALVQG